MKNSRTTSVSESQGDCAITKGFVIKWEDFYCVAHDNYRQRIEVCDNLDKITTHNSDLDIDSATVFTTFESALEFNRRIGYFGPEEEYCRSKILKVEVKKEVKIDRHLEVVSNPVEELMTCLIIVMGASSSKTVKLDALKEICQNEISKAISILNENVK